METLLSLKSTDLNIQHPSNSKSKFNGDSDGLIYRLISSCFCRKAGTNPFDQITKVLNYNRQIIIYRTRLIDGSIKSINKYFDEV